MSNIQVTVAGLGKRSTVTVQSASSPLYQILEDFCKKHSLDVNEHDLKLSKRSPLRKTKNIDLSLPWRLSGLSNHTELEIVLKPSQSGKSNANTPTTATPANQKVPTATIGFQLHDGRRFKEILPLDYNLWQCLRALEVRNANERVNVTQVVKVSSRHYCVPVVSAMNHAYNSTLEQLTKTRLSELGIKNGGNMLLRVHFQETEQTFEQVVPTLIELNKFGETTLTTATTTTTAVQQQPQEKVQQEKVEAATGAETLITPAAEQAKEQEHENDEAEEEEEEEEEEKATGGGAIQLSNTVAKDVKLYFTPQQMVSSTATASNNKVDDDDNDDITDEDFEIRPDELQKILAEQERKKRENSVLRTKKHREMENEKKRRVYDRAVIRVRFPTLDGLIIQGTFDVNHTLSHVEQFVRECLSDATVPFYMFISPPVQKFGPSDMEKTLQQLKLIPAAIININVDSSKVSSTAVASSGGSLLNIKPDLLQYLQRIQREILPENLNKEKVENPLSASSSSATTASASSTTGGGRRLGGDGAQRPKWFRP